MFDRLLDLLRSCWEWFVPFVILHEYERGVVLRFGRYHREIGPGFHWTWPAGAEQALSENVVTNTCMLPAQPLTSKDGAQVCAQALLTYKIVDVRKLLLEVEGKDQALRDTAAGVLSLEVSRHTWDEIRSEEFLARVHKAIRKRGFRYGIEVDEVQLPGLQRMRSYMLIQAHSPAP